MARRVLPQQLVRNLAKAAVRKRRKKPASNWANLRRVDGTFKVSKRGKYNARGRFVGDHWFPSKAEADRYAQLVEMQGRGTIAGLELQVPYRCVVAGQLVCTYRADFRYVVNPGRLGQRTLVEDVKGMVTPEYRIKRKLVKALFGFDIIELPVPKRGTVARYRYLTADQFGPLPAARARRIAAVEDAT